MPLHIPIRTFLFLTCSTCILGESESELTTSSNYTNSTKNAAYHQSENVTDLPSDFGTQPPAPTVISDGEVNATISEETRLIHYLIKIYKLVRKDSRPVLNHSEPVKVHFGMGLVQLEVDEEAKVLVTSMWTRYQWRDMHMVWSLEEYGGIRSVEIESKYIWLPDVMLYNTEDTEVPIRYTKVEAYHHGRIRWYPPSTFRASCSIHIEDYPFDRQHCKMIFGSWTSSSSKVELLIKSEPDSDGIDLSPYEADRKETSGWNIMKQEAERIQDSPNDGMKQYRY